MGRSLHQLSLTAKQSELHLCICCRGKGKSILNVFYVCLTNRKNKAFSYGHWASIYHLKKFNFSILYSSQGSLLA